MAPSGAAAGESKPTLAACATLSAAYFAFVGLFNPFAPLWYQELGLSVFAVGMLASLSSWTRLFAPYVWGTLADRSNDRVKLIRFACAATLVSASALVLPLPLWGLVLVVLTLFSFNAGIVPLTETVVAIHLLNSEGSMDARRYGRVRVWGSVGFMLSVLAFGAFFERLGMRFFPWAVLGVLGLSVAAAWRVPAHQDEVHHSHAPALPILQVLLRPEVRWFAGMSLTVLAHASLYAFFSLYLDSLHYGKPVVGGLWAVSVVVEIVWFTYQRRWLERISLHAWLVAAALASTLRFGLTAAFGAHLWVLVGAQCLHAITFAAQHTVCIALISRYFPGRLRGRGQALYTVIGYGVSGVVGGLGGAALSSRFGYASVFWAASLVGLLSAWCCWRSLSLSRTPMPQSATS